MVHEFFPVLKQSIANYVEKQKNVAVEGQTREKQEDFVHPVESHFDVPRKPSISERINEIDDDTKKNLRESQEIEAKMMEIRKIIKDFDKIDFSKPLKSVDEIIKNRVEADAIKQTKSLWRFATKSSLVKPSPTENIEQRLTTTPINPIVKRSSAAESSRGSSFRPSKEEEMKKPKFTASSAPQIKSIKSLSSTSPLQAQDQKNLRQIAQSTRPSALKIKSKVNPQRKSIPINVVDLKFQ